MENAPPSPTADAKADPVPWLDVSALQDKLFLRRCSVSTTHAQASASILSAGIRGPDELVKRVNLDGSVAVSMYPVTLAQLLDIADAGQIMPPKVPG
ncbi:MAG TPA: hypothetical protein VNV15_06910 [Opitutaceae bacterium]|nr:hypothetical protein [Opitutaceae bacterium]